MLEHMKPFYFVRHGHTEPFIDKDGISSNNHLTDTGRLQAQEIKPLIDSFPIDYMVTSPRARCIETAEIIAPSLFPSRMEIGKLRECSFQTRFQLDELYESPEKLGIFPTVKEFIDRIIMGINEGLARKGTPLFVGHGGTYGVIIHMFGLKNIRLTEYCDPIYVNPSRKQCIKFLKPRNTD